MNEIISALFDYPLCSGFAGLALIVALLWEFKFGDVISNFFETDDPPPTPIDVEAAYWIEHKSDQRPVQVGYQAMQQALRTGDYSYICTAEENNRDSCCASDYEFSGVAEDGKHYHNTRMPANSIVKHAKFKDRRLDT